MQLRNKNAIVPKRKHSIEKQKRACGNGAGQQKHKKHLKISKNIFNEQSKIATAVEGQWGSFWDCHESTLCNI